MFFNNIESLLKQNKLSDALMLINSELKKSYDFSNSEENQLFMKLKDSYQKIEEDFLRKLNSLEQLGITRSYKTDSVYIEKVNSSNQKEYFIEALKNIKVQRASNDLLPQAEAYILMVMNNEIDTSLKNLFCITEDLIFNADPGTYLSALGPDDKKFFTLLTQQSNIDLNPLQILEGFGKLIESIYDQQILDIKIIVLLKTGKENRNIQKILLAYTLCQLLYLISSHSTSPLQPQFTFIFNDEINKNAFERTVLRLGIPELNYSSGLPSSQDRVAQLARKALTRDPFYIGQLQAITKIIDEDDIPLLIYGETGVGKSYLAKIIHEESIRNKYPFEEINCGSITIQKLEQNLFGWIKGAFTDAKYDKKGKVIMAEGGTLFLDEIDRTDSAIRDSLITFLENKKYTVIGEEKERTGDVRLVFGTNKNLKKLINQGKFEEDFFNRISDRIITIPPLRNRKNDIEMIVDFTLNDLSVKKDKRVMIESEAVELLKNYSWPGNTRELVKYIKSRFHDCVDDKNEITAKMITDSPFENFTSANEEDFDILVDLIKKFMDNWDISKGDFLHTLIAPIAAKLYVDDSFLSMSRTQKFEQANDILGMSGKAFTTSTLQKNYDQFAKLKTILELE